MAIFDDVVVNAKSAASAVSKKAGEIYDISKLRITLASLRSDLNKNYQALGEAVYSEAAEDEIDILKAEIADIKQNIFDVEKIIAYLRNTVRCPKCGQKLNRNAAYCFICGTAIPKEEKTTCSECGADIVMGAKFCYKCGAQVSSDKEEKADNSEK